MGHGRHGQILVPGSSEHVSEKQKWGGMVSKTPQGLQEAVGWRRVLQCPSRGWSMCPTGKSGQSPACPEPSGARCQASVHSSLVCRRGHAGQKPWPGTLPLQGLTHLCQQLGLSQGLGLSPPE